MLAHLDVLASELEQCGAYDVHTKCDTALKLLHTIEGVLTVPPVRAGSIASIQQRLSSSACVHAASRINCVAPNSRRGLNSCLDMLGVDKELGDP